MSHESPTTVVLLTPPGRGAVATILVSGPQAIARVAETFLPASGRKFASEAAGRIAFGRWGGISGEEVVVCRLDDLRVEVHCHGGQAAPAQIIESLLNLGCQTCPWPQWLETDEPDPIAVAARIALADAPTERTAVVLLDQYHGALRHEIDALLSLLDRSDASAADAMAALRAHRELGMHLTIPWQVAIAGRPNVGKSSLVNALLGYERAIVFDAPGTTRDVLSGSAALAGWPVELSDTAGLRATADLIEAAGVARANERIASADLALLVFDASQPWTPDDAALTAAWPKALVVLNKCDLAAAQDLSHNPCSAASRVSALTRDGIDDLASQIAERLVPEPPSPGAAVPFTLEQAADLDEAARLLAANHFAEAARLLRNRRAWRLGE